MSHQAIWVTGAIDARSAEQFAAELAAGFGPVDVYIDSPGGIAGDALDMASALQASKRRSGAYLLRADSASLFVTLGADSIVAAADASALVHKVRAGDLPLNWATRGDLVEVANMLRKMQWELGAKLDKKSGQGQYGYWNYLMDQEQALTAQNLLNYGLASRVSETTCANYRRQRWAL